MKPRTTVPADLVRDLKCMAWNESDAALASELLLFDPDTAHLGGRTPMHLTDGLLTIAKIIARRERDIRKRAAKRIREALTAVHAPPTSAAANAADVMIYGDDGAELRALQARIWRVVDGLMLTVRGGQPPVSRAR